MAWREVQETRKSDYARVLSLATHFIRVIVAHYVSTYHTIFVNTTFLHTHYRIHKTMNMESIFSLQNMKTHGNH